MQLLLFLSVLLALSDARPQEAITSRGTPLQINTQNITTRYTSYIRDIFRYGRFFVPISFFARPKPPKPSNHPMLRTPSPPTKRNSTTSKIKNPNLSHKATNSSKLNRTKVISNNSPTKLKDWPYTEIISHTDLNNYIQYTGNTNKKKRPTAPQVFTKISNRPVSNNDQNWFQIKLKPMPEKPDTTMIAKPSSLPVNVKDKHNPYLGVFPPNNVFVGTTVTLTPEALNPSSGESSRPVDSHNPCPTISITSNVLINKEVCPDVNIIINNHVSTNDNFIGDDPLSASGSENVPLDYEASEVDLVEAPVEEEVPLEDEVPADVGPPVEDVPEELAPASSATQEASSSGGETQSSGGNLPQLPDLPELPERPDRPENDDEENEGFFESGLSIVEFFNPFNYPFISFILAPMVLLATGTLGLSSFFIPFAVFPTLFLSRKAKETDLNETIPPIIHPDGWFWHHEYKTWTNLSQLNNKQVSKSFENISRTVKILFHLITQIKKKFDSFEKQSWKRRKKRQLLF